MTIEQIARMDQQRAMREAEALTGATWELGGEALNSPPAFKVYILQGEDGEVHAEVTAWRGTPTWCEWSTKAHQGARAGDWRDAAAVASRAILLRAAGEGA